MAKGTRVTQQEKEKMWQLFQDSVEDDESLLRVVGEASLGK